MKYVATVLMMLMGCAFAQDFNLTEIAHLNNYSNYQDVWGYTDEMGNDYALLGMSGGVSIVDATDPGNIHEVDYVPWVGGGWYDMKVYGSYMYVSSEGSNFVLIVDLSGLPGAAAIIGEYGNFPTTPHNIQIDTGAGLLFVIEDFNGSRPVSIHDLSDPENPVELSNLGGISPDAHDVYAADGTLYVAEGTGGAIAIVDISNPASPSLITRVDVPSPGYVHNVWANEDHSYMISTEETVGKTIKMWDIQDLDNVALLDEWIGENQFAHNAMLKGGFAFISHYGSGCKVLDIADPTNIVEVGSFGTASDWGVYPYASNDLIYVSDIQTGLYVLEFNNTQAYRINGVLRDADSSEPIEDGWIEITETGTIERTGKDGSFRIGYGGSASTITLEVTAFGYEVQNIVYTAVQGGNEDVDLPLSLSATGSVSGAVLIEGAQGTSGHSVSMQLESPFFDEPLLLETTTDATGNYLFEDLPVSDDNWVNYTGVVLAQVFPYPAQISDPVVVEEGQPVEVDFDRIPADLLVVNDDFDDAHEAAYDEMVTANGGTAYIWSTSVDGEVPIASIDLMRHNIIIWYTANSSGPVISEDEQAILAEFLDGGGNLILTSSNAAEWLSNSGSSFGEDYLGIVYEGAGPSQPVVSPVSGHPVFGDMNPFGMSQDGRDAIKPLDGGSAVAAFQYLTGDIAGVTLENSTAGSKLVFAAFGIEAINAPATRADLIARSLAWFDVSLDIKPVESSQVPQAFALEQNYPNPFNPTTNFAFRISGFGFVNISIYDIQGRLVKTIVEQTMAPGVYEATWNGTNSQGNQVASGVYFYQLIANAQVQSGSGFSQTKKMILMR